MTKFNFNAAEVEPWKGAEFDGPKIFALLLWMQYQNEYEDLSFLQACELSAYDFEIYKALQEWAWSQSLDDLPDSAAAVLGRALGRPPPRKGKGATARRDACLRAVAAALVRRYQLPLTRGESNSESLSASAILTELPGLEMVTEKTIVNILTKKVPKNRS